MQQRVKLLSLWHGSSFTGASHFVILSVLGRPLMSNSCTWSIAQTNDTFFNYIMFMFNAKYLKECHFEDIDRVEKLKRHFEDLLYDEYKQHTKGHSRTRRNFKQVLISNHKLAWKNNRDFFVEYEKWFITNHSADAFIKNFENEAFMGYDYDLDPIFENVNKKATP
jgi:hypothetical protein